MPKPIGDFIPNAAQVKGNTANAQATREALRALKVALAAGTVDPIECLRGNPPQAHAFAMDRVTVGRFFDWMPKVNPQRQWEICVEADVAPHLRVGDLGRATRNDLARLALMVTDPFDPRLGAIEPEPLPPTLES